MEWFWAIVIIIILLPWYIYICSKSATMGKFMALKQLFSKEEKTDGKGKEEEK